MISEGEQKMYTYERLLEVVRKEDNDGAIAQYLLNNLHILGKMTLSKTVRDTGISKASIHRFYNKGGYASFKDMVSTLDKEIKQKQLQGNSYDSYKNKMISMIEQINFDEEQLLEMIDAVKGAERVAFYGNTIEILSMRILQLYMYTHHIKVDYLDQWDMIQAYRAVNKLGDKDVFIMIESAWRIQSIYEYSMNNRHMLNLDLITEMPFKKYYIGEANSSEYLLWKNINVPQDYNGISQLSLNLLDQKLGQLL